MEQRLENIMYIANKVVRDNGLRQEMMPIIASQLMHESDNGTSTLAIEANNYGGLTGINDDPSYQQPDGTNSYRKYASLDDFATSYWKDFIGNYEGIRDVDSVEGYAQLLRANGYYTDSLENYITATGERYNTLLSMLGNTDYTRFDSNGAWRAFTENTFDKVGNTAVGNVYDTENEVGFGAKFIDSFMNAFVNNPTIAYLRMNAKIAYPWEESVNPMHDIAENTWKTYQLDEDDIKRLQSSHLPPAWIEEIREHAVDKKDLESLLSMREADYAREQRVASRAIGMHSVGALLGGILDPLYIVPFVGEETLLARIGATLGKEALVNIGSSFAYRVATTAISEGAINIASEKVLEETYGTEPNYIMAGALGAGASAGLMMLGRVAPKGIHTDKLKAQYDATINQAIRRGADIVDANEANIKLHPITNDTILKVGDESLIVPIMERLPEDDDGFLHALLAKIEENEDIMDHYLNIESYLKFAQEIDSIEHKELYEAYKEVYGDDSLRGFYDVLYGTEYRQHIMQTNPEVDMLQDIITLHDSPDVYLEDTQTKSHSWFKKLSKWMENSNLIGNQFGRLVNSPSKHLQTFARTFLVDPRQWGRNMGIAIESMQKVHLRRYTQIQQDFIKGMKTAVLEGKVLPTLEGRKKFNQLVMKAFHEKNRRGLDISHYGEGIQKAVRAMEEHRKLDLDMNYEHGIIDKKDFNDMGEWYRSVDMLSLNTFLSKFQTEKEARQFLTEYAEEAVIVGDENVKQAIDEWVDTIMTKSDTIENVSKDKSLSYFKKRLRMNTDYVKILPDGTAFSFDDNLRSNDALAMMQMVGKKTTSTIALKQRGITDIGAYLETITKEIEKDLQEAVHNKQITEADMKRQMDTFKKVYETITGTIMDANDKPEPRTNFDRLVDIILKNSYWVNGANMGLNQIGETMGSIGVNGSRGLFHYIPALHDFLHDLKYGDVLAKGDLQYFRDLHLGLATIEDGLFNPRVNTTDILQRQQDIMTRLLGHTEDILNGLSGITSQLSGLDMFTNKAIKGIQADIFVDMLRYARGETSGKLKRMFNEDMLKNIGITDADTFFQKLLKYTEHEDDNFSQVLTKWEQADNHHFLQTHVLLDLISQKAVLQGSLGNAGVATNGLWRIMNQFKNFSQMAINGHMMRAIPQWQREDTMMTISSALGAGMIWAGRQYATAWSKYANDEKKRKEYLEKRLTPENMIRAGMWRNSMASGASYFNDFYEMMTGADTIRTTVNRQGKSGNRIADAIAQFPSLGVINDQINGATTAYNYATHLEEGLKRGDTEALKKLFPYNRYVPIQVFFAVLNNMLDNK